MASITHRGNSYRIRVNTGFDSNGKRQYATTTWTPAEGMSDKQIEKALQKESILFEEKVRTGQYISSTLKFSAFADLWIKDYAEKQLKQKTVDRYKTLLPRINEQIGSVRLDKLTPKHIIDLLNALDHDARQDLKHKAYIDLKEHLKTHNVTNSQLAKKAHLSTSTIAVALSGKNVSYKTAYAISEDIGT